MSKAGLFGEGVGVVAVEPTDELLHPPSSPGDPDAAETSYFGFSVPERDLNCAIYHWFHPVLGLVSGGVILVRGEVESAARADFIDYRNFMPMPTGDIDDVTHPSGVRVRVVKPLEEIELAYSSADGRLSFELVQRALMPAAGKPGGGHFAQAMVTSGELVLDGERIEIGGSFTRDRSWSTPRPESNHEMPPLGWAGAVFGEDLALHFSAHDGDELDAAGLRWGYVFRDGETRGVAAVAMRTARGPDGAAPRALEVELRDSAGDRYELSGEVRARAPLSVWPNMIDQMCLMEYRLGGRRTFGDFQDLQFNTFLRGLRG